MIDKESVDQNPATEVTEPTLEEQLTIEPAAEEVNEPEKEAAPTEERTKQPEEKPDYVANAIERNVRALREKAERIEKERDEALQRLKALETHQAPTTNAPAEEDLTLDLRPDDLAEGKHLSKVERQIKRLESQLKTYQDQTASLTVEARLKAEYPDFDRIVSADNVKELSAQYPELAATLNATPDLYAKAVAAYTMISKLDLAPNPTAIQDRITIAKNASKPRPIQSISPTQGKSALEQANAFANGLTPELQAQLWEEMQESMKAY